MTTAEVAQQLNSFMPAALDTSAELYRLLFADVSTPIPVTDVGYYFHPLWTQPAEYVDGESRGAISDSMKNLFDFIDYYTKTLDASLRVAGHFDKIAGFFAGISRIFSEPDSVFVLRYKALIERNFNPSWDTVQAIRDGLSYLYDAHDIFISEAWPREDLLTNGNFDNETTGWTVGGAAVVSSNVEDRHDGTAIVVDNSAPGSYATLSQEIVCTAGRYSAIVFFSRTEAHEGSIELIIQDGAGLVYNEAAGTWSAGHLNTGIYATVGPDAGDVGMADVSFVLEAGATLTVMVKSVSGTACIIDSVRFGRVDAPAILVALISRFEAFYDGAARALDGLLTYNGYEDSWKNVDIDELVMKLKPAGVWAEVQMKPATTII